MTSLWLATWPVFPTVSLQYQTMNDHIDSLGKVLKTLEKTQDNLKGTINHLTPILHKKGLQNKIRSITNCIQSPSVSFADPISESTTNDSMLAYTSTSPEPKPVPPPQRHNEQEFCQTCQYPLKYDHVLWAMGWDDYKGHTCRCPMSEDTSTHWSLWWNMSTLTFWTHSTSPTLCTSLHIDSKFHFPQIALSMPLSVPTPKHRRKRTPSYLASESKSCHCCMYYYCVAPLFYFPLFL